MVLWLKTFEIEFVNNLVKTNLRREDEPAAVGIVEHTHRLVELVAPVVL